MNELLRARRQLGNALTEWRDAGAHPEVVVFAIEDLFEILKQPGAKRVVLRAPRPPEPLPTAPEAGMEPVLGRTPEGWPI